MLARLTRQPSRVALLCLLLGACTDAGGNGGNGSGEGSGGFVEEDGSGNGSGSGEGSAAGSGEGSGIFVDTPVFLSVPPAAAEAGRRFSYPVRYAPTEGVTLALTAGPEGAALSGDTLEYDVPDDGTRTATFTLALLREGEDPVEQSFTVAIGHAPVFSGVPSTRANRGDLYRFTPDAYDDDGDTISLGLVKAPAWLTLAADGTLSGQPDAAGAFDVTLVATDPIGLSARLDWTIAVVEPLSGLTAQVGYLTTAGGTLDLFAASMPEGAEVRWGDVAATRVERLSAGTQLRATFAQLPVGVQPVVVTVAGALVGQLREPLLVIPAATGSIRGDAYQFQLITPVRAAAPPRIRLPGTADWGIAIAPVGATYAGDVLSLTAERPDGLLPGGVATLAFDGIQSLPIGLDGAGAGAVVAITPAEAAPGDTLVATVAGLAEGATVTATWSDSGAAVTAETTVRSGSAALTVPAAAAGLVTLSSNGGLLRAYATSATTASALATSPSLVWANREVLTAGLEQHLLVRGHGFANPALRLTLDGGTARVVWTSGNEAVLALQTNGRASALLSGGTGGPLTPLWRFSVEAERLAAGERLDDSSVAPGEQRTAADVAVGTGAVLPGGGLRAALAADGLWLSSSPASPGLGLDLTEDWTRLGEPIPGDKRALLDGAFAATTLYLLTVQGDLIAIESTGDRARLTSPWTGVAPRTAALLSSTRLSGASRVVAQDSGLLALLPERGELLGVAPRDESVLLGSLLDAQRVAPLVTLDRPLTGAGFLAANSGCAVFGDRTRMIAVSASGATRLDLTLSGEAASSSGSLAEALGGGLTEAALTDGALYLLDLSGQLLSVSLSAGCPTLESTVTLVAEGLTGSRSLRSDGSSVLLSGHREIRDGATGVLLATTATGLNAFVGRTRDALVTEGGLVATDGAEVAEGGRETSVWVSRCPSEGCAVGGASLLASGTDGTSLLDLGDSALIAAPGPLRIPLSAGPLSATALPYDTTIVGEVEDKGALLTSAAGGLWFAALRPGGLSTLIAPPEVLPAITLVGGLGTAAPEGSSVASAGLLPRAAAYDASLRLWIADADGRLFVTGGDGLLTSVTPSVTGQAGCLAEPPTVRDLALDAEGRLLVSDENGELFRREDDGAFCTTGIGGLGSDAAARLYGDAVELRGTAAGIVFLRPATGTAIGIRPVY